MSYTQIKTGSKDVFCECKLVRVTTGAAVPTPATGYQISAKLYTSGSYDFYLEYKEITGNLIVI